VNKRKKERKKKLKKANLLQNLPLNKGKKAKNL
jgi:hypothetical protein